ncbi:unnamed protein product [Staurois parvus]|uniref:Uncharacterized protein n=1 Tax=Staurois parvus TaxID=386267 RepID=A0ABN9CF86_9NEOB|nr:unnamed protein product [Staurois parvus]
MTRDCGHSTGDDQETADTVQEMTRDCGHSTGLMTRDADTVQEMTRDCITQYRR